MAWPRFCASRSSAKVESPRILIRSIGSICTATFSIVLFPPDFPRGGKSANGRLTDYRQFDASDGPGGCQIHEIAQPFDRGQALYDLCAARDCDRRTLRDGGAERAQQHDAEQGIRTGIPRYAECRA